MLPRLAEDASPWKRHISRIDHQSLLLRSQEIDMNPSQVQLEKAAGIDQAIANHMMAQETVAARTAMGLLQIQTNAHDPAGFELLKAAVADCRKELS